MNVTIQDLDAAREAAALCNRHHELLAFSGVRNEDDIYALHELAVVFVQASEAISQDVVDTIVLACAAHAPAGQGPQEHEPEATTWHELARDAVFCFLVQIEQLIHRQDGRSTFSWFGGSHADADEMKNRLLKCDAETLKHVSEAAKTTFARAGSRLESNIAREWAVARAYVQRTEPVVQVQDVEQVNLDTLDGEAKALALLVQHPGWSNKKIADNVPCSRTQLYRWDRFMAAREQQDKARLEMRKGSKKGGKIEAW